MSKFLDEYGLSRVWQNIKNYVDDKVSGIIIGGGVVETSENIPPGFIGIWSGATVPDGWALCDGGNGTPDLRGRFVLGNSSNHEIGSTGGSETVTLTVDQMPSHYHNVVRSGQLTAGSNAVFVNNGGQTYNYRTDTTGSSQPHPNMPPYYVLAYIMKL